MKPTKAQKFASAYDFFLARAGYSWNPTKGETEAEGRERCARALADAEAKGTELGLVDEWSVDEYPDTSFMNQEGYTDRDRECAEFYSCLVRGPDGEVLESLGGIHEDARDPIGARYYRRVVRAELFSEALTRKNTTS